MWIRKLLTLSFSPILTNKCISNRNWELIWHFQIWNSTPSPIWVLNLQKKIKCFLLKFLQNQLHKKIKELFLMTKFEPNFSSPKRIVNTFKKIGKVDFLIKILATMSQLWTERSLKSEKWSNFWDFTGGLLLSRDLSVHNLPIVANIFIRTSSLSIILGVLTSLYHELWNLR